MFPFLFISTKFIIYHLFTGRPNLTLFVHTVHYPLFGPFISALSKPFVKLFLLICTFRPSGKYVVKCGLWPRRVMSRSYVLVCMWVSVPRLLPPSIHLSSTLFRLSLFHSFVSSLFLLYFFLSSLSPNPLFLLNTLSSPFLFLILSPLTIPATRPILHFGVTVYTLWKKRYFLQG